MPPLLNNGKLAEPILSYPAYAPITFFCTLTYAEASIFSRILELSVTIPKLPHSIVWDWEIVSNLPLAYKSVEVDGTSLDGTSQIYAFSPGISTNLYPWVLLTSPVGYEKYTATSPYVGCSLIYLISISSIILSFSSYNANIWFEVNSTLAPCK